MKTKLKILQKSLERAFAAYRRTKFLIGWTKKFGATLNLFVSPSKNKESLNF